MIVEFKHVRFGTYKLQDLSGKRINPTNEQSKKIVDNIWADECSRCKINCMGIGGITEYGEMLDIEGQPINVDDCPASEVVLSI